MKLPAIVLLLAVWAGHGQAAVIVTTYTFPDGFVTPNSSISSPLRRRGIDLNQDGAEDFNFIATGSLFGIYLQMASENRITGFGYEEGSLETGGFATSMPPLSLIGADPMPGAEWWGDIYGAIIVLGFPDEFSDPRLLFGQHYVGLEFKAGDLTHYGYVRFGGDFARLNILETGWETEPGRSIVIPVPEPAVGSCLSACSAITLFRRRRLT